VRSFFAYPWESKIPIPQSGGLWIAASLDGGDTSIFAER